MYTATFTNHVQDPDKETPQTLYLKHPDYQEWLVLAPGQASSTCAYHKPSTTLQLKFKLQPVPRGAALEVVLDISWAMADGKHSFTLLSASTQGWSQDAYGCIVHVSGRASLAFDLPASDGDSPDGILIVGTLDIDMRNPAGDNVHTQ